MVMQSRLGVVSTLIAIAAVGCSERAGSSADGTVATAVATAPPPVPEPAVVAEAARPAPLSPRLLRRFRPLPASFEASGSERTPALVDLGRSLYYERRLSLSGVQSCNSCHPLSDYGVDHASVSAGQSGHRGTRNSPTVYGAAGSFAQFWDGRAETVEDQATMPILNPDEMAMPDEAHVVVALKAIPDYADAFRRAFPAAAEPITLDNVGRAIGAFERGLVAPSRWDDFLRGDEGALSTAEKDGLKTFLDVGCMVCHTGVLVGGSMFERAGVMEPWPNQHDHGRESVTHSSADRMMFKVPTLRNVARTAPYFHDASAATLPEAVKMMGRYQLGMELSEAEIASIVTWLGALTGELPRAYIEPPNGALASAAR